MGAPAYTQVTFRIRNDDGTEVTATWRQTQGTDDSIGVDANFRVRFLIDETNNKSWTNTNWTLYYNHNSGGWNPVSGTTPIQWATSSQYTTGTDCVSRLTGGGGAFLADNNGMVHGTNIVNNSSAASGNFFEAEYCLTIDSAQVANNDTILLRVYIGSSALDVYTDEPIITVVEAATVDLTNVGAIASAQAFGTASVAGVAKEITTAGAIASAQAFGTASVGTGTPSVQAIFVEGFEHGVATPTITGGGLSVVTLNDPTVQGTTKRTGNYALEVDTTGGAQEEYIALTHHGTAPATIALVFYFMWATAPSGAVTICRVMNASGSTARVKYDPADQKIYGQYVSTGTKADVVLAQNTWYRIDVLADLSTTTSTLDIKVNGTAAPQTSYDQAISSFSSTRFGFMDVVTGKVYFDDIVISDNGADYPIGEVKVVGLSPNGEGTHNNSTNMIEDESGNDIDGSTHIAYTKINSLPIGNTSNYLRQFTIGDYYIETTLADLDAGDTNIMAVSGLVSYTSETTSGNSAAAWIREGTTDHAVKGKPGALADFSDGSLADIAYDESVIACALDRDTVNALTLRFGYAGDVTPPPYFIDFILQVAIAPAGDVTLSGVGAIASAQAFGTAAVTQVAKEITTAGAIASAQAFGTASIAGEITGAGAIASSEAFGTAAVAGVAKEITTAGAIASAEAHGTQIIETSVESSGGIASAEAHGTQIVETSVDSSGGIASAEAFGTAAVTQVAKEITGAGAIASAEAFGTAAIEVGGYYITDAGAIASAEAFGTAAVSGADKEITDAGAIASAEAFGTAIVSSDVYITGSGGISSAEAFGTAVVAGVGVNVTDAGAIASAEAFGTAVVAGADKEITTAGAIASAEAFGTALVAVAGVNVTDAGGIASQEAHGTQIVGTGLEPTGISSSEAFGTAVIAGVDAEVTDAGNIASAEAFGVPIISIFTPYDITDAGAIASAEAIGVPWVYIFGLGMYDLSLGAPDDIQLGAQDNLQLTGKE